MSTRIATIHADREGSQIAGLYPELIEGRTVVALADDEWDTVAPAIEAALVLGMPRRNWSDADRLRLIQIVGVGTDRVLPLPGLPANTLVSNAAGLSAVPMAEYAVGALLMVTKRFPEGAALQADRKWKSSRPGGLAGRRVVILGTGAVGRETARRLGAFGVERVGVRRRPEPMDEFDLVVGLDQLDTVLDQAAAVVIALPLNEATRGIIGRAQIQMLASDAVVVNVARGPLLDEEALVEALRSERLAGAVLDVVDHEPPPDTSELWDCPRLHLTAHVSWHDPAYPRRVMELFADNLTRIESGLPIRNQVDRDLGYAVDA